MKKPIFFLLGILFILGSCSTEAAEKVADEFHQKLDGGEVDYIVENLVDQGESSDEILENFREYFQGVVGKGEQKNRQRTSGFNKKYNNGITTVKLNYTFEVDGELIHERLVLIDRDIDKGYKIFVVTMHPDESFVEEFTKDY